MYICNLFLRWSASPHPLTSNYATNLLPIILQNIPNASIVLLQRPIHVPWICNMSLGFPTSIEQAQSFFLEGTSILTWLLKNQHRNAVVLYMSSSQTGSNDWYPGVASRHPDPIYYSVFHKLNFSFICSSSVSASSMLSF